MRTYYKYKIFLFGIIFIFLFGCKQKDSDILSTSSAKNYLLVHRGGYEYDGIATNNQTRTTTKNFFADRTTFKMRYDVTPSLKEDSPQTKGKILYDIKEVSSKLDSNSTLIYFYNAHGNENGSWCIGDRGQCDQKEYAMFPKDLITKIEDGRTKNGTIEPFKRLIIIGDSCSSEEFMLRFQQELATRKEKNQPKLFDEAIYIATSYADKATILDLDWSLLSPILFLLRAQQIASCNGSKDTLQTTFNKVVDPFLLKKDSTPEKREHTIITKLSEVMTLEQIIKDNNPDFNEKNPTFNDLALIIKNLVDNSSVISPKILKFNKRLNDRQTLYMKAEISFNISFSDESLRNESIFPPINNCQL